MDSDVDYFQQCKYIHEVELVNMKLQMRILETHLETKDRLLRNLEDIIDEQEARIANMEEFIQGRSPSYVPSREMLKGISVLSLDFGSLSDENVRLKQALAQAQRQLRTNSVLETDEDYESDIPSSEDRFRVSPVPQKKYNELAKQMVDNNNLAKLKRIAEELKNEKDELRTLAHDTKEAFSVCMTEVKMMLESKTTDFFQVLISRYKSEMEKRKQLHNQLVELNGNIRVFYRLRPSLNATGPAAVNIDDMDSGVVHLATNTGKKSSHSADRVIPADFTQQQIFDEVSPIITSCIDGYNVCIFAYGHTGSGKTHTMEGPVHNPGINQRAIMQLFENVQERDGDIAYDITVSMIEIYNEKLKDLLNPSCSSPLSIRLGEDGRSSIPGLIQETVTSVENVKEVLGRGKKSKAVASTDANAESSRSHVIVRVVVTATNKITNMKTIGRLNLVDLAGSERVSQTNATGQLLNEAKAINKSLSELGNVVSALRQNLKHVPFRNCQLTRFLEDSLNGDSKTLVMVHLSPDNVSVNETISSMNFAEKIGQIQVKSNGNFKRDTTARRSGLHSARGSRADLSGGGSPRK